MTGILLDTAAIVPVKINLIYYARRNISADSTAVNPALTIMANALRVGDHLLERLG